MQKYNCIIVEDEPLAAEVLLDYVKQVPFLNMLGICTDAIFAMEMLQKEKIDLMFLDIHLPKLKGLDFIKTLKNPPHIIITTAYHGYALKSYEYNVLDYLLKPVEFSRFLTAVNKLNIQSTQIIPSSTDHPSTERESIFFNVSKKKVRVFLNEILYIESLKEYVRVVTKSKSLITKFQLGQVEEILAKNNIIRIHRSFLVAKDKIDVYSATDVEIEGKQIPIGRSYKEMVLSMLEK